jgi:FkbM family methyltransferase
LARAFIIKYIKSILNFFRIYITRNQQYDAAAQRIYNRVIKSDSNCIDIGCHKGEILDQFLKFAPRGSHFAFEPIPAMFQKLQEKYSHHPNVHLFDCALSDHTGSATFQYVSNAPAYSGLRQRRYDISAPQIIPIDVKLNRLDDVIPENVSVGLIKIDVEGAEYEVLMGGKNNIANSPQDSF